VVIGSGSSQQVVVYEYDASGQKLRKTVTGPGTSSSVTDYVGNQVWENGALYQLAHEEGRISNVGSGTSPLYRYEWHLQDHLGNNRVSFAEQNGVASVVQAQHYDPWGWELPGLGTVGNPVNRYKFHNQEQQAEMGWYQFKWRMHDPLIGRFISIDPIADKFPHNSTFAFAENKLGSGIEYEGLELVPWVNIALSNNNAIIRPIVEPAITESLLKTTVETTTKIVQTSTPKARPKFTPEQLANFAKGRKVEAEQLAKHGYEKNNKPYTATDPKTGKEGVTIPDGFKPDGGTVEVKHVKNQSYDGQLRLQKELSNQAGVQPELIINKGANISQPVRDNFNINVSSGLAQSQTGQ
jgi:RHS repeat-associated protein